MSTVAVADSMRPEGYRVGAVRREGADTATLTLVPQRGECPRYQPGQFNMLYAFGVGEIAVSISGDAADRSRLVHTVRAVGAVSTALTRLQETQWVGVRGPFGTGWPVAAAAGGDVVLVAGGLGLAPLRPAIYHVLANRRDYRRVAILAGMRTPAEILYRQELEQWRSRLDAEVEVTVDHPDPDWFGHVGVVPALVARAGFEPQRTTAMVCGPEIMMRFTVNALLAAGLAGRQIHVSMERNMKCAVGLCGHCQFGPDFICKDGPVMSFDRVERLFAMREI